MAEEARENGGGAGGGNEMRMKQSQAGDETALGRDDGSVVGGKLRK